MDQKASLLLAEWKEIRESLRYFGNKRFAQLTVFIAASGFMLDAFLGRPQMRTWLAGVGIALGLLFLLMERSSVRYWNQFARRGEDIERATAYLQLMTYHRPKEKWLSATNATYAIYAGVVLLWLIAFRISPDPVTLVDRALASAPSYAGDPESVWDLKSMTRDDSGKTYAVLLKKRGSQETMVLELEAATGELNEVQRLETVEEPDE